MDSGKALKIFSVTALVIAIVVAVPLIFYSNKDKLPVQKQAPDVLISYEDLPEKSIVTATLSMRGKVTDLENTGNGFILTPEQKKDFSFPYSIKATLKSGDDYRDISWNIDNRGVAHKILLDGYKPQDRVTFIMNGQKVYTIPFDWSGRIELGSMLIVSEDSKPCFSVDDNGKTYGFCHYIRGKKAA